MFIASVGATRIDDIAAATFRAAPDDLARLGFAVAHALDPAAPRVEGLDEASTQLANGIAAALLAAARPLLVSGTGSGFRGGARGGCQHCAGAANPGQGGGDLSRGARGQQPGHAFLQAGTSGRDLDAAFAAVESGAADTLIVLENDLYRRAEQARVDAVLDRVKLIVIDHQSHATATGPTYCCPAAPSPKAMVPWSTTEGRAQRYFQVYDPAYYAPQTAIREVLGMAHGFAGGQAGPRPRMAARG